MFIHNHHPNQHIVVKAGRYVAAVMHGRKHRVPPRAARTEFAPGALVRVSLVEKADPDNPLPLATYRLNEAVRDLHVGQVTSRFEGGTWDDQMVVASAAVQGRPWIHIHNLTSLPLQLNENIFVPPKTRFTYKGRHHFGVPLGLTLRDPQRRYRPFRVTKPVTDIYYGVVSPSVQPLFGGWQHEFTTEVDFGDYYNAYGRTERVQEMPFASPLAPYVSR
uniref:Uncharacterized protein n=1 Tax=Marseillevirus LCMAC103 TaxID=2506604 RepID=A0A481YU91_9VIRU|nr:MAG: hypothetical protein LCMAC103_00610 [Marseillevirus LCMAC103]